MKYAKILTIFTIFLILSSCGIYKKTDARKVPIGGKERARKNIEEGRGFSLKGGVDRPHINSALLIQCGELH